MKKIIFIFPLLILTLSAHAVTVYKWVDNSGVVNFTDDYEKIPPRYRNQVEVETRKDDQEQIPKSPTKEITPSSKGEVRKDIYGRDETWWRDKTRPWREQLQEATTNYENTNRKIIERSEALSRKYWSPTQYKMNMVELDKLKEERAKYQVQIDEANGMLRNLSKEAEESKANPDWLK
jgi:hypothetical protein